MRLVSGLTTPGKANGKRGESRTDRMLTSNQRRSSSRRSGTLALISRRSRSLGQHTSRLFHYGGFVFRCGIATCISMYISTHSSPVKPSEGDGAERSRSRLNDLIATEAERKVGGRDRLNERDNNVPPTTALFALSANFLTFAPAPEPRFAAGAEGGGSLGAGRLRSSTILTGCKS